MDRPGAGPPYETPLVSSRTLRTAVSSVGSSRLPLRHDAATPSGPQTVGRSSLLRRPSSSDLAGTYRNAPATVSRLPMRRPSLSNGSQMDQSEAASLKRQLARALSQVEEFKHAAERQKLEAAMAADKAQAQVNEYSARIEKLERHRAILLGKEREAAERDQRRKEDEDGAKEKLEQEVRSLLSQLDLLKDEHIDLQESFTDLEHSANQAVAQANHHQARTIALQQELELVRQESEERLRSATEEKKQRLALEAELEREKMRAKDSGDSAVIREELHRQVSTLRTLEKENGKLHRKVETYERQHANIELLKETNRSLERKVKAAEELRQQLAGQTVELELLRREKADWSAFVKPEDTDTFSSPRKITKNLAATRIENATLRDRLNTHELELQRRDRIIGQLEAKALELETQLQKAAKELEATKEKSKVDGSQAVLLRQEVGMLKRHLESYATEEAVHNAGNYDAQKTARLVELEELLEAHKREIASLTQQVAHWRGLVERYGGNTTEILELEEREKQEGASDGAVSKSLAEQLRLNEELRRELDEARNELALMEQELEALSTQVEQLEENQGIRGAYNAETTKVLEFRDSPDRVEHAIRTATLERLQSENQALLRRLGGVERGLLGQQGAGAQELVPRESLVSAQAEANRLKALVQQKETMLKRIGQARSFDQPLADTLAHLSSSAQAVAEKTEAMRLAVQKLLGFQLSFLESGRIRVTSVYAPSKDRSLAFDPWPGGPMPFKLVSATDEKVMSIDEVRRSIGFWLDGRQSLPGFMASLTMALYEETTRGQARGVVFG
ncbi:mitotic checkpoint family protein [Rhodotorula toruloides]|uniref:Spindle assembly checkpoint component MAD1 n=1 Tax=Rhodotorula toruloides TaxID=5286 RepID=A0A511KC82_RHOTO|nr:mitotic checkpoint family protein [Rhodotorula toruloides]